MDTKICQSCGMPLSVPEYFGTNENGGLNEDYCIFCFKDGKFTQDMTMEQMIEHCAGFVDEFNKDSETKITKAQAVDMMREHFPGLKRWKND